MTATAALVVPPRERTRREIKERALELFLEHGYEATSVHDIAVAAGCSKATVMYHFENKAAILSEVLRPSADRVAALVTELQDYPLDQVQERAIDEFIDVIVEYRGFAVMLDGQRLLTEIPAFMSVSDLCRLLPRLLAGGDDDDQISAAIFALNGAIAECRDSSRDDQSLRAVLQLCLRRLLL